MNRELGRIHLMKWATQLLPGVDRLLQTQQLEYTRVQQMQGTHDDLRRMLGQGHLGDRDVAEDVQQGLGLGPVIWQAVGLQPDEGLAAGSYLARGLALDQRQQLPHHSARRRG